MRISTFQHANWTKHEIMRVQTSVAENQQRVSSGKKYLRPSDDPLAAGKTLAIGHALRHIEQMEKDITDVKNVLSNTEGALSNLQQALDRTNTLVLQALNGTQSPEDKKAIAHEVASLIKQVKYLGNTQYDGRYIFGGSKTETAPYDDNGAYQGDDQSVTWKLNEGYDVTVFQSGNKVITPALRTLETIYEKLNTNDMAGLQTALTENRRNTDNVINAITEVGAIGSTIQSFSDILGTQKIALEESRSAVENIDMAEAISDLSYMNATYQATLQAVSMMNKVSILNYM
ncbi:flagellar hook-associated protein 3 [Ectobacillus sp. JY-23]|uniref:flagellar hook-associated protein 3 n=1 Tax=Ectobacillus sp. JY-23 TaxID=2933872 RepID=UPI001FF123B6|nr:flagellar hook-associated protein 3 [Ectobacillus sp. JY-23]UOY93392.1 flagellar hook-associated protein 3 [Ectobacillus sp. JY-23]